MTESGILVNRNEYKRVLNEVVENKYSATQLKIVTINVPDEILINLETLITLGFYPSRSEILRDAIRRFLIKESKYIAQVAPEEFRAIKTFQMKSETAKLIKKDRENNENNHSQST